MPPITPANKTKSSTLEIASPLTVKAVFGFFLVAAVLVLAGITYYRSDADRIRQLKNSELSVIAQMKAQQILRWCKERRDDAQRLAHSPQFISQVAEWLHDPSGHANREDLLERLQLEKNLV